MEIIPWWAKNEPCQECGCLLIDEHNNKKCQCGCHGEYEPYYP